jgi:hypothetical protein
MSLQISSLSSFRYCSSSPSSTIGGIPASMLHIMHPILSSHVCFYDAAVSRVGGEVRAFMVVGDSRPAHDSGSNIKV